MLMFDFMENEHGTYGYSPYDFLHGSCDIFSAYLHNEYGYPILNILNDEGRLIHSFCDGGKIDGRRIFIDIRGETDDFQEFIDEFLDEIECLGYPQLSDLNTVSSIPDSIDCNSDAYRAAEEIEQYFKYWG